MKIIYPITSQERLKTIKIYVEGGYVRDVTNLPDDFDYEIIDSDIEEN